MKMTTRQYGDLSCQVVDALPDGQSPSLVAVVCHGFGAPGTDLVGLGPELLRAFPQLASNVQFIFPAAPLTMDHLGLPGGRAWWYLDMEKLNRAVQTGEFRDLREEIPEGLDNARNMLNDLIAEVRDEHQLKMSDLVLGGFSQGSMLSTDVTLRAEEPPAALCIWSGTLLAEAEWRTLVPNRKGLRVLQSHGIQDQILPFQAAVWLRDMMSDAGLEVEFIEFEGPHTIPMNGVQRYAELLLEITGKE